MFQYYCMWRWTLIFLFKIHIWALLYFWRLHCRLASGFSHVVWYLIWNIGETVMLRCPYTSHDLQSQWCGPPNLTVLKKKKKENCHKICIWLKRYNNMIFVFNSESPTNIAVQNETEEGIMQAVAEYSITMNCSVNSGIPKETIVWKHNNTIMVIWGSAFLSNTLTPTRKDHLKNLTCSASNNNFNQAITKTIQLNVQCKFSYIHMLIFLLLIYFVP